MSEKHIKEKKISKELKKSFVVLESKLMQLIKGDTGAMFFFQTTCLLSDHRVFCFKGEIVGHFAMF